MGSAMVYKCGKCGTLFPDGGVCPHCFSNVNNPDTKNFFDYCKEPPDAIESHENMVVAKYNLRYIGETITNVKDRPKDRNVYLRHVDVWTKQHVAQIGHVVTYDGVKYVYGGEERGWIQLDTTNERSALPMSMCYDKIKPNWLVIKKVIFNAPATIVLWGDGTKTVVQCGENDAYDPEKGLAMAVAKKAFGNSGRYYNTFKKYLPKTEEASDTNSDIIDIGKSAKAISDGVKNIKDELNSVFGMPKDDKT
ncbi:MAG: hypothetical protein J6U54_03595 [Clostridiales bacterium]|nr:hypothetical protein [Clostridiales bacterium]